jgi:hypothetical protein
MSKPSSKSKDQVRSRRQRNLVAKYNPHKGGYHTPDKYDRIAYRKDWERMTDLEMEYGDIDELH